MSTTIRVGVAQMRSGITPQPNLDKIAEVARAAEARGVRYLLTPEVSVSFTENKAQLAELCSVEENEIAYASCAEIARRSGLYLHIGSLLQLAPESNWDGKFANRSVLFAPDGAVCATYDKIHLFDADLPGDKSYRESANYTGGSQAVLADVENVKLGMTICYDVRFGTLYTELAKAGAQILSVPAAFAVPSGRAHWEVLLRARAIETGCFVMAAAQGGAHENGRKTYGHSMIVNPWGEIIAQSSDDEPGLLIADLDLSEVNEARARIPALANHREYSLSVNHDRAK